MFSRFNFLFRLSTGLSTPLMLVFLVTPAFGQLNLLSQKDGAAQNDRLGYWVAGAGDVNGDGVPDYIIGAPYADPGGISSSGCAYVYSGASGALLYQKNGTLVNEVLGASVAGAGDVNGDGRDDFIIGTKTQAYVYSGATGNLVYQKGGGGPVAGAGDVNGDGRADFIISNSSQSYVYSGSTGSLLYQKSGGSSVAGIGDINGDGRADFLIGDQNADPGFTNGGSAYVYSGATGSLLYQKNGAADYDLFGSSAAGAGDVNGDGKPDFIIGARTATVGGLISAGAAYVYSGATGALLHQKSGAASEQLGESVAGAGDVDGDGKADFLVSSIWDSPGGLPGAGSAFLYSGATGALLYRVNGSGAYDNLGCSVAGVGDLNGDGGSEFIVGALLADPSGRYDAGSAYIYGSGTTSVKPCDPDITPPTLTCAADKQVACGGTVVFDQPTATDNCDASPTLTIVSTTQSSGPGSGEVTHTRTWTAADVSGNISAPCSQKIVVGACQNDGTSQITQTSATCGNFKSKTSADLSQICYTVRKGKVSKTSPSSFIYYFSVAAPSASFSIDVVQTCNNAAFPFIGVARNGVTLYDGNCTAIGSGVSNSPGQAQVSVSGATVGQSYTIAVKYSGSSVVGTSVGSIWPQVHYDFAAKIGALEVARDPDGLNLAPCTAPINGNASSGVPAEIELRGNYPNPFNASTSIRFSLLQDGFIRLEVYNMVGQKLRTLVDEAKTAGEQTVVWDGKDGAGNAVASGVYFYKITAENDFQVGRMIFLK